MTQRATQAPVPPAVGEALWRVVPAPLRRLLRTGPGRRLVRFAPAAVLALAATQLTFFVCQLVIGTSGIFGVISGAAGWLAGAAVSYVVSRWAWERKGRPDVLRETIPFVVISICVGIALTGASSLAGHEARVLGLQGLEKKAFVQGLYFAANCVTFVTRFLIFHYALFADRRPRPPEPSEVAADSGDASREAPLALSPAAAEPDTLR